MTNATSSRPPHVAIAGGGVAGLVAAVHLGRAGLRVTLLEKGSALGGRGATRDRQGFHLNMGPHALYAGGAGKRVLDELGIPVSGHAPGTSGAFAIRGGERHTLPSGLLSLMTTGLFSLGDKVATGKMLARLSSLDPKPLDGTTVADWLSRNTRSPAVSDMISGLIRVSSYTADFTRFSMGVAVRQVQTAFKHNVLYLDGGWQTMVDSLARAAKEARVTIQTGVKVERVMVDRGRAKGFLLADGGRIDADAVLIANTPGVASSLVPESAALAEAAQRMIPVRAACLDLALRKLPDPGATFALGLDRPLYMSVHTRWAKLAPEGGAVIHAAAYLPTGEHVGAEELEALVEKMQPGYKSEVVDRHFLPSLTVYNALPEASNGGLAGRPGVEVPGVQGAYLAGDWVGNEGLLADASFASAKAASVKVLEQCKRISTSTSASSGASAIA